MSELTAQNPSTGFKIGLGILLFLAVGNILGYIGLLIFDPGPDTVFLAWMAFNFIAATILMIPYRRGEKWAWYAIWAMVVPYALIIFINTEIGPIYLAEAALMTLGQMLTYGTFFPK